MKYSIEQNRSTIHDWLKFYPECIKFIETLAKSFTKDTREQVFQLLADHWRWDGNPQDELFNPSSAEVKYIAAHLIYYIEFIKGQRTHLPNREHIPVTYQYLRCYALTHSKCRRKKRDPITTPEQYSFLGEIVK